MRTLLYLLLCAALASGVNRIAHNGGFGNIDDTWLAFLRGNVERVTKGSAPTLPPLLIEITEGGGASDSWPPSALDYALLLDRLAPHSPGTVVIGTLPPPSDDLESEILSDKATALPRAVLPASLVAPPPADEPDLAAYGLAEITISDGDISLLPLFAGILSAPSSTPSGFTKIDLAPPTSPGTVPLLARTPAGKIAPGLPLAALIAHTGAEEIAVSLGKQISLASGTTIPITSDGSATLPATLPPLPVLNASTLFDPTGSTAPQTEPLPPLAGRLIFLGEKTAKSPARTAAHIATAALDQKWVRPLARPLEIALWIVLALIALAAYKAPAARARSIAFFTAAGYIVTALFSYSIAHLWWPLPVPAAFVLLICISAMLRRPITTPENE